MTNTPHDVVSGSRDTPASEETKITAEMIEAGVEILLGADGVGDGVGFFSPSELAARVYRAMDSRRRVSRGRGPDSNPGTPIGRHGTL